MTKKNIFRAIKELKIKNSKGCDIIPQGILIGGMDVLLGPLTVHTPVEWKSYSFKNDDVVVVVVGFISL